MAKCRMECGQLRTFSSRQSALGAGLRAGARSRSKRSLQQHASTIAAICIEPLDPGGCRNHHASGQASCAEFTGTRNDRHDILLICDEIAVGFGRTGRMFACEQEDVTPDLMCVGKGLDRRLPAASGHARNDGPNLRRVSRRAIGADKTFFHGHTFTGNPLACAAALASIERLIERQQSAHRARSSRCHASSKPSLQPLARLAVAPVRRRHSAARIGGRHRTRRRQTRRRCRSIRAPASAPNSANVSADHGVILRPLGDVITVVPPLAIDATRLARIVDAIAGELDSIDAHPSIESSTAIDVAGDA